MKALTIKPGWAHLIAASIKDIENRSQPNHRNRGWVLIHVSKTCNEIDVADYRYAADVLNNEKWDVDPRTLPCGQIIGAMKLGESLSSYEQCKSMWFCGPWGWQILDAVEFDYTGLPPNLMTCKGSLGFWRVGSDQEHEALIQMAKLRHKVKPEDWA